MSTRTQQHKSKIAQITCAVAAYALAPIQSTLGVTAADRFRGMQNLNDGGGSFMKSRWFTIATLIVLAVSIAALVIVTLYRKLREVRERKTEDRRQKTNLTAENAEKNVIKKISTNSAASAASASGTEQRVSNIEKRVSAIEKRLSNLEEEVSSLEVIEDEAPGGVSFQGDDSNAETQVLEVTNTGSTISPQAGGLKTEEPK
jgi:hypothetical protein